jgi:hypothetical protein
MKKVNVGTVKLKAGFTSEMARELRDFHISDWENDMEKKLLREMRRVTRVQKLSQIINIL